MSVRGESEKSTFGADEGVLKARGFRRQPESGEQWSKGDLDAGALWEPYPDTKKEDSS